MLEIDGSQGGGQLLRTSLALAAITDRPVRVTGIRGNRPEPGLKPQHKTAVEVVATATNATTDGVSLGSEEIEFTPETPTGGELEASIDTAGSIALVFDTLLPVATRLEDSLALTVTGGTAVKWAPPLATYHHVKLPLLRQFGLQAALDRHRTGYYPKGGGKATLFVGPSTLEPLELGERGALSGATIDSRAAQSLADQNVARRQAGTARSRLAEADVPIREEIVRSVASDCPGSSLTIALHFEESCAGFDALGERGKPAETVAKEAAEDAMSFLETSAAVDEHLADQLLVFLALAGGTVTTPQQTDHIESSLSLLEKFGYAVECRESGEEILLRNE